VLFFSSQLYHDGHPNLAASLAKLTNTHPNCPPSERLLHVVSLGLKAEQGALAVLSLPSGSSFSVGMVLVHKFI